MAHYWRVFPWDETAARGEPFSPSHVPATTGRGRFDLPVHRSPVLYVAETGEHAVAEALQPWRNRPLLPAHLKRAGYPLALVRIGIPETLAPSVVDLCDPTTLVTHSVGPDRVASRRREVTQSIAHDLWDAGHTGLRWWSAFHGDWHGVVLFTRRLAAHLTFDEARRLDLETSEVRSAAGALGMRLPGSGGGR